MMSAKLGNIDAEAKGHLRTAMDAVHPISQKGVYSQPKYIKTAAEGDIPLFQNQGMPNVNVHQGASRRFYDPMFNYTNVMSPKSIKQKNRYYRYYYDTDEFVASILELHAELPYSDFELELDDPLILREFQDCTDELKLVTGLTGKTLEYNKIGEIFLHHPFDEATGRIKHCITLNPDFMEISHTPYLDDGYIYELMPDDQLKRLVNSSEPEDQLLKKRLPKEIINKVLTGQNIRLKSDEITHIARKASPYDPRGQSILNRLLRLLQYEDKLREAQLTIADNFIYPLKLFLLGDPNLGWIPNKEHQEALASMLEQAQFDPNFALIYHYALKVDVVHIADKIMNLSNEWDEINKKKAIALGIPQSFISGDSSYSSANVGLQTQLARYRAVRDVFEKQHILRLYRIMAEKNGWYTRDKKEIVGNFRVKRSSKELESRIMLPEIIWHKKLVMRDDQAYLAFLNNVFNQGKGPVSALTLLRSMGLDAKEELKRKRQQRRYENTIGEKLIAAIVPGQPPAAGGTAQAMFGKVKSLFKSGKKDMHETTLPRDGELIEESSPEDLSDIGILNNIPNNITIEDTDELLFNYKPVSDSVWLNNLKSPYIDADTHIAFIELKTKLDSISKKYGSSFKLTEDDIGSILSNYKKIYVTAKLQTYSLLKIGASSVEEVMYDYADEVILNEFETWISRYSSTDNKDRYIRLLKSIGNSVYAYGQLRVYQEYGISKVKLANVSSKKGSTFDIDNILKYRSAIAPILSPRDEIIIFNPKMEYLKYASYPDDSVFLEDNKMYVTYSQCGITVRNAPIEYVRDLNQYITSTSKYLTEMYKSIEFVKDITDIEAWKKATIDKINISLQKSDDDKDEVIRQAQLRVEKFRQAATLNFFADKKTLYISNKVDVGDNLLIDKLHQNIDILSGSLKTAVQKNLSSKFYNLSSDELIKYAEKEQIEAICDANGSVQGYKITEQTSKYGLLDEKLKIGKVWDASGQALYQDNKDPIDIYNQYVTMWTESPHLMDKQIFSVFNSMFDRR
jgi:hypothetical protein